MENAVTITLANDPTNLGPDATRDDLSRWGENLRKALECEFGRSMHLVLGYGLRTTASDVEVDERIRQIESSDEWIQYL